MNKLKKTVRRIWFLLSAALIVISSGCDFFAPSPEEEAPSTTKAVLQFSFRAAENPQLTDDIDCTITDDAITGILPFGTNLSALSAYFVIDGSYAHIKSVQQIPGATVNDFTDEREFTVVAEDGSSKKYSVRIVNAPNSAKEITEFKFTSWINWNNLHADYYGVIDNSEITVTLPFATEVENLCADFTSTGDRVYAGLIRQYSLLSSNDYTQPVVFTVYAQDGSKKEYTVRVIVGSFSAEPETQNLVSEVSRDNLIATISTLSSIHSRRLDRPGKREARDYLVSTMESMGYAVELEAFSCQHGESGPIDCWNIISQTSVFPEADDYIIVCGHYDSYNLDGIDEAAPGANDNGTGIAVIIELARILKDLDPLPVKFIFFDAEEIGLVGSRAYASLHSAEKERVRFVLAIDMVGGYQGMEKYAIVCNEDRRTNFYSDNDLASRKLNTRLVQQIEGYTAIDAKKDYRFYSDHGSFEENGFVVLCIIEDNPYANPYVHTNGDTVANLHETLAYDVAKGSLAFIYDYVKNEMN